MESEKKGVMVSPGERRSPAALWVDLLLLVSFCAPLLLFNAYGWVHVVFLYKWMGAFLPLAYLGGFLGIMLLAERGRPRVDAVSLLWLGGLLLLPLQLFLPSLLNATEWLRNWLFFAALGAGYFVSINYLSSFRLVLLLRALLGAGGLSTIFGFLQQGRVLLPFVFPPSLSDRFLGNTGLDSILGVMLALASFSGTWLLLSFFRKTSSNISGRGRVQKILFGYDALLLTVNLVGLWKAGARSSLLAFLVALGVLLLGFCCASGGQRGASGEAENSPGASNSSNTSKYPGIFWKVLLPLLLLGVLFFAILPRVAPIQRRNMQEDLSLQAFSASREGRLAIWALTWEMIREHPLFGVGLGNYKWNYLDTLPQFHENWNMEMRDTHWAHNEYLQIVAETGFLGGVLLLLFFGWWGCRVWRHFRRGDVSFPLLWGVGALVLLGVDALFSRPLHHPESAVWFSLALGVVNREVLRDMDSSSGVRKLFGGVVLALAAFGIFVFVQSFPAERSFGWISKPRNFVLYTNVTEMPLPESPLLLRDFARELRWKRFIMVTRLEGGMEEYRHLATYLSDDYRLRPRLEILPELVEVHRRLGDAEQFDPLIRQISQEELDLLPFLPPRPVKKSGE